MNTLFKIFILFSITFASASNYAMTIENGLQFNALVGNALVGNALTNHAPASNGSIAPRLLLRGRQLPEPPSHEARCIDAARPGCSENPFHGLSDQALGRL